MKVLHIITSLKIGGAEFALFNRLKASTNDQMVNHLVICFYDGPVLQLIRNLGIEVILIKGLVKGYDPYGLWSLYKNIQVFKPDIIHTSLWVANIVGRFAGMIFKIPVINELHGDVGHEGLIRNIIERFTNQKASKIVAISPSVACAYERQVPKCHQKVINARLTTIPNGIDKEALVQDILVNPLSRSEIGIAASDFVIGTIGRFEKIKSYEVLIKSVVRFLEGLDPSKRKAVKVCMVGDGSQRQMLERLVFEYNLQDRVIFVGFRVDAYRFYHLFDCFALSSQSEGLSLALLQALALGIPVITTHKELTHDAVINEVNGYLVPVNDIETYASKISDIYQKKIKKSDSLTPLSYFPFSIRSVVNQYASLYNSLKV